MILPPFRTFVQTSLIYRCSGRTVVPSLGPLRPSHPFNLPAVHLQTSRLRSLATVMNQIHLITDDLEKPDLDDRSYRVIRLPNKLEALLVHDPETDKASASLNVNVGNFSDDEEMPGMAHAVEHLLFMGTEKVSHHEPVQCFGFQMQHSATALECQD